jgi:hypothetical protein
MSTYPASRSPFVKDNDLPANFDQSQVGESVSGANAK